MELRYAASDLAGPLLRDRIIRIPGDIGAGAERPGTDVEYERAAFLQGIQSLADSGLELPDVDKMVLSLHFAACSLCQGNVGVQSRSRIHFQP